MRKKRLKGLVFLLCLSVTFGINADASYSQENKPDARKVAEYNYPTNWDGTEQGNIDAACIEAYNKPDSKLVVIVYGKAEIVREKTLMIKYYAIYDRGINPDKIITIEGGETDKPTVEFWLVPKDSNQPTPKSLADKSSVTKTSYIGQNCYACEVGPPDGWVYEAFAEELIKTPDAKGYLVFYKDKYIDGNKALKEAKKKPIKEYKINPSRIRIVGGGMDFGRIEFYVVPKGKSFRLPQKQKSVKKNL